MKERIYTGRCSCGSVKSRPESRLAEVEAWKRAHVLRGHTLAEAWHQP